jgi:hypothetical protein
MEIKLCSIYSVDQEALTFSAAATARVPKFFAVFHTAWLRRRLFSKHITHFKTTAFDWYRSKKMILYQAVAARSLIN